MLLTSNIMQKINKKKTLRRELIVGGGLAVLFSPFILLAILVAIRSIGFGMILTEGNPNSSSLWPMFAVYGTLLILLIIFSYKFCTRLMTVIQRMLKIRQEQRRVAAEFAHVEDRETDADELDAIRYADRQYHDLA